MVIPYKKYISAIELLGTGFIVRKERKTRNSEQNCGFNLSLYGLFAIVHYAVLAAVNEVEYESYCQPGSKPQPIGPA